MQDMLNKSEELIRANRESSRRKKTMVDYRRCQSFGASIPTVRTEAASRVNVNRCHGETHWLLGQPVAVWLDSRFSVFTIRTNIKPLNNQSRLLGVTYAPLDSF